MPSKTASHAIPTMPMRVPPIYQAYVDACVQAMAETYVYSNRIMNIALQATQRSMNESAAAGNAAADAGAEMAPEAQAMPTMAALPDLMAGATTLQNMMMRNAAEWQQQFVNNLHQYGRGVGRSANRTNH